MIRAVEKRKPHALVVYEDGHESIVQAAKSAKERLAAKMAVQLRPLSELSIPEILSADAYVFAISDFNAPAWAELKRVMSGINLARRPAASIAVAKSHALALKRHCAPAELSFSAPDLVLGPAADIGVWADAFIASI